MSLCKLIYSTAPLIINLLSSEFDLENEKGCYYRTITLHAVNGVGKVSLLQVFGSFTAMHASILAASTWSSELGGGVGGGGGGGRLFQHSEIVKYSILAKP